MGTNYNSMIETRRVTSRTSARNLEEPKPTTDRQLPQANGSATFSNHAWEEVAGTLRLSGRELQIVRGMFNDKIQYAIADDLGISPHTVHTHIERLYRKLEVSNRAQLLLRIMTAFVAMAASSHTTPLSVAAIRQTDR